MAGCVEHLVLDNGARIWYNGRLACEYLKSTMPKKPQLRGMIVTCTYGRVS